jgi:hypothetical protein
MALRGAPRAPGGRGGRARRYGAGPGPASRRKVRRRARIRGAARRVGRAAAGATRVGRPRLRRLRERRSLLERSVRPMLVVVLDVRAQDSLEVFAGDDQQPVETLAPHSVAGWTRGRPPTVARQHPAQRRQQRSVGRSHARPRDLPPQHLQLMAKNEDLDLLRPLVAAASAQTARAGAAPPSTGRPTPSEGARACACADSTAVPSLRRAPRRQPNPHYSERLSSWDRRAPRGGRPVRGPPGATTFDRFVITRLP